MKVVYPMRDVYYTQSEKAEDYLTITRILMLLIFTKFTAS